ncbi:MAG: hypothetical protein ACYDA9_17020 [Terriglobia bacterium]
MQDLFPLGQIVATPGALEALARASQTPMEFLLRHASGNWGRLGTQDVAENEYSLKHGFRPLSRYCTVEGQALWLITEADRSVTSLFLPEEY